MLKFCIRHCITGSGTLFGAYDRAVTLLPKQKDIEYYKSSTGGCVEIIADRISIIHKPVAVFYNNRA